MPNPQEICTVQAGGSDYRFWKEVEVNRNFREMVSQCSLVVAEIGDLNKGWKSLRLSPGDPAKVMLAGQLAATGKVTVRQVAYDGHQHNVRFVISSNVSDIVKSSLVLPPGQFKNQTLTKLANAATKKYGVSFSLRGAIKDAEKVFERVSLHMGESPFQFILRLAQMRNVHLIDDATGNLVGVRGGGGVVGQLQEGRNILAAELVWNINSAVDTIHVDADQHGNDEHWGDKARAQSAEAKNKHYKGYAPQLMVAPQPGDIKDAQMYANHSANLNAATMFAANVTVRGWMREGGQLWLNEVGQKIDLYSPMLLPMDHATLAIGGATCRQSDAGGTTTTLELVLPDRLGADPIALDKDGGGPTSPDGATPFAPDDI